MASFYRNTQACFFGLLFFAFSAIAEAQVIDRIDVKTGDVNAKITVRFSHRIHYLRHSPAAEARDLRVFLRLVDSPVPESELMQDTLRAPKTDRVPLATVTFPELRNGMLVSFSQVTKYEVSPGGDGQSIVLTVPLLPATETAPKKPIAVSSPVVVPPVVAVVVAAPVVGSAVAASTAGPASERKSELPVAVKSATAPVAVPAVVGVPTSGAAAAPPVPLATPSVEPAEEYKPAQPERSPAELEALTRGYLDEARQALVSGNTTLALNRLNRILGLPTTSQMEAAQALIGEAREANGEPFKAKAEYELYLKLFPKGSSVPQVKKRLAALPSAESMPKAPAKPVAKDFGPAVWSYSGSLSMYYYTGKSQIETLTPPPPGELTFNKETLSAVDQRSWITSANFNGRFRDGERDSRLVVRATDNRNDLDPRRSYTRLYSAYGEHNDRKRGYSIRAGRQNPTGMGVLDRFDGVQAGYNLNNDWRANVVAGDAVEFGISDDKVFYGASVDFLPLAGRPGVSLYGIEQKLESLINRRAVGTELRYFDGKLNIYGTLDYDVLYRGLNIGLVQGNYLDAAGNNYFFAYDYRRAPSYALNSVLNVTQGVTLQDVINAQGITQVRRQVADLAALSEMFSAGVTHPLNENLQVGVDYRASSISATRPVDVVIPLAVVGNCLGTVDPTNDTCIFHYDPQAASGLSHAVTLQAIASNLLFRSASGNVNWTAISAPSYRAQSLGLSYIVPIGEQWRIDTNLRYYTQSDDNGSEQSRFSPSMKLSYQWRNSLYVEGETGMEKSHSTGQDRDDQTRRDYWYFGLRWDFR